MDFYQVKTRESKSGATEIYPDFVVKASRDLMVRGGAFLAIWDEDAGLWSTDEYSVQRLVDADLHEQAAKLGENTRVKTMSSYQTGVWKAFKSYIGNMPDSHQQLDGKLTFADTPPRKEDHSSKRLPYSVKPGSIVAYDTMMSKLYAQPEREKLEWATGSIIAGDSVKIQKFLVLYGDPGTGKSTFLDILEKLCSGYCATFDAKALTSGSNAFATESLKNNPLVAIQHDSDLSKVEDNTKLNSIVSHEEIEINAKYRSAYPTRINAMLFLGTNKSVRISDAKSGLIRRLIDVHPTGDTFPPDEYEALKHKVQFEIGAIANHCLGVYRRLGKNYYSRYRPTDMILRTDIFYNFLMDSYELFKEQDGTTLKQAWALYKTFCDQGGYDWRLNQAKFRDELRNYFAHFTERGRIDGVQVWNLFSGFRTDKIGIPPAPDPESASMVLDQAISLLDGLLADVPAQYASSGETPAKAWAKVNTKLSDIDSKRLHYVKPGDDHVVIDFDLRGDDGEKNLAANLRAASSWPATYAELSKSGQGVHLHYRYEGKISELSSVYADGIEVKTFKGDASLRRQLTLCNDIPVATINGGLPLKEKRVLDIKTIQTEKGLREMILRNIRKEIHAGTKPSIDFIWKILEDAWISGMHYDVTDMRGKILAFANGSTNHSLYCVKTVLAMKFASESATTPSLPAAILDERLVLYDIEVFPNLLAVCWKFKGDAKVVKMANPSRAAIEELIGLNLVGFNNRRYDNHILYAWVMGYSLDEIYQLSQKIISGQSSVMFGDAYNLSHADIFDFSSLKQSLKKFQIDLGLNHQELGFPWDQPVPEEKWPEVLDYCANDVITSEQVFDARKQDYVARQILASLSGLSVNDTTQKHAARIIFGTDRNPQEKFKYTDLSTIFPGYTYGFGKSEYRGEDPGEGGYVYAEPGMYTNVAVLDVASMHPTSIGLLDLFGPYTGAFNDIKTARIFIKRRDYENARRILDGKLAPFLGSPDDAKALSDALKIIINIVYGLTSASFSNPFRDIRNKDNIVAKRGALFMIDLKKAVQEKGFQVVHIKTDSIKIPNSTPEIIQFVMDFGIKYGYEFEHEVTYSKFCLVNDAVYVAKDGEGKWHATGAQFAHPYVFKTLFSGERITFDDLVETKTVTAALYLDFGDAEPHFVGRAGAFVPVLAGTGGGTLLRGKDGQFHAATGTKGFLWKEAAIVKANMVDEVEEAVDMRYFRKLTDAALENLSKFGDAEWFRS
jgi:hypothetical protein